MYPHCRYLRRKRYMTGVWGCPQKVPLPYVPSMSAHRNLDQLRPIRAERRSLRQGLLSMDDSKEVTYLVFDRKSRLGSTWVIIPGSVASNPCHMGDPITTYLLSNLDAVSWYIYQAYLVHGSIWEVIIASVARYGNESKFIRRFSHSLGTHCGFYLHAVPHAVSSRGGKKRYDLLSLYIYLVLYHKDGYHSVTAVKPPSHYSK